MSDEKRTMTNECYSCVNKRSVPGSCHSACARPDPAMTGYEHGIRSGWFSYPINFEPVWKTKDCSNYQPEGVKE